MEHNHVMIANGYDKIDGRNAYQSPNKALALSAPELDENKAMKIAVKILTEEGTKLELPLHQVLDLAIFLTRSMLYFRDAYRMPLLYDPEKPGVERLGIQGGVMDISVDIENPNITKNIDAFSLALGDLGELTGDRLRTLKRILEELEY